MGLTVRKEIQGTTILLRFKGVLDITTCSMMDDILNEIDDVNLLVLDFHELEFIDSTGIGSIIHAIYLAQEKNFKLKIQGVDEFTHQVFDMIGLYQILETFQGEGA